MSTVIVVAPVIIASWPAIAAAVTAAVGTMGFAMTRESELEQGVQENSRNRAEIDVEDSEILADAAGGA